ncbi:damage-inducible protein CinA [Lampropedia cohaerens]|uniref:Damage-inducible protein CinA n=1 Tax=Lampropedia cohaerens TaxID=1610491 RepID=A0A0U1PX00_9BURK|nr:CinA family protein [Lampropedia cohaerens]KKW66957.1 damage-inducible protein CinA [Lampropedia cohaerens]
MNTANATTSAIALVADIAELLLQRQAMLCTAESCTGGLIAAACTDVPGSSGWFDRGMVTYSNRAKQQMLGVDAASIATHGAVSEEVAQAMACGALARSAASYAVAVTGIAGPGGGTPSKPVGLVWFCWAGPDGYRCASHVFPGDRQQVRQATVLHALQGMRAMLTAE